MSHLLLICLGTVKAIMAPKFRIEEREKRFNSVIKGENSSYKLLSSSGILTFIDKRFKRKKIDEIINDSKNILDISIDKKISKLIDESKNELNEIILQKKYSYSPPCFPYEAPYPYQLEAFKNWKKNGFVGMFEMATGTGKTLTSILCLIKEYERTSVQKNIVVVPGQELVNQWHDELKVLISEMFSSGIPKFKS